MPDRKKAGRRPASPDSLYSVSPAVKMVMDRIAALEDKTGRSLEGWMTYIGRSGPKTEEARRNWLREELGLGTNTAAWLAARSHGKGREFETPEGYLGEAARYVEDMYAARADLRPVHDAVVEKLRSVCPEVRICPCKTIVPFYRNHVVAQIRPRSRSRLDLGFALGALIKAKKKLPAFLIDTGGFAKKDRITHAIALGGPKDVDERLDRWMRTAWDLDA